MEKSFQDLDRETQLQDELRRFKLFNKYLKALIDTISADRFYITIYLPITEFKDDHAVQFIRDLGYHVQMTPNYEVWMVIIR